MWHQNCYLRLNQNIICWLAHAAACGFGSQSCQTIKRLLFTVFAGRTSLLFVLYLCLSTNIDVVLFFKGFNFFSSHYLSFRCSDHGLVLWGLGMRGSTVLDYIYHIYHSATVWWLTTSAQHSDFIVVTLVLTHQALLQTAFNILQSVFIMPLLGDSATLDICHHLTPALSTSGCLL